MAEYAVARAKAIVAKEETLPAAREELTAAVAVYAAPADGSDVKTDGPPMDLAAAKALLETTAPSERDVAAAKERARRSRQTSAVADLMDSASAALEEALSAPIDNPRSTRKATGALTDAAGKVAGAVSAVRTLVEMVRLMDERISGPVHFAVYADRMRDLDRRLEQMLR